MYKDLDNCGFIIFRAFVCSMVKPIFVAHVRAKPATAKHSSGGVLRPLTALQTVYFGIRIAVSRRRLLQQLRGPVSKGSERPAVRCASSLALRS